MVHTRCHLTVVLIVFLAVLLSDDALAVNKQTQQPLVKRKIPQKADPAQSKPPNTSSIFAQGEMLRFSATFNQLEAGGGEIRLRKERQADGHDTFRFTGRAQTSEWVDLLYKRRDNADATFGMSDYSPRSFLLLSREGDRDREYGVRYDPQTKMLIGSVKRKNRIREYSLPAGNIYDPVSALYLLRSRNLVPGVPIETQVFTGRSHYRFVAQVLEKEIIEVAGKKQSALRLHPQVYSLEKDTHENILPKETTLWVSADPAHIPLKFESETIWGWIVVELDKKSVRTE